MTLDVTDLVPTLIVVWVCALAIAAGELAVAKYRGELPARPLLFALSRYVCFGSMFTIFGIVQRANSLGLISYRLYIFAIVMAVLAVGGAVLGDRWRARRKV